MKIQTQMNTRPSSQPGHRKIKYAATLNPVLDGDTFKEVLLFWSENVLVLRRVPAITNRLTHCPCLKTDKKLTLYVFNS